MKAWVDRVPAEGRRVRSGVGSRASRRLAGRGPRRGTLVKILALLAWWLAMLALAARPAKAQAARDSVAVAAHALPRGHVIVAGDVAWIPADSLAKLGHRAVPTAHFSLPIAGTTRRAIAAGEPLRAPAVTATDAVAAGERVAVVYREAGVELRMQGTALNAAPLGGRAAVRVDARRRLTGTVAARGVVQLD